MTSPDLRKFISSQDHMIDYIASENVTNCTAHDMLVERQCFLGRMLSNLSTLEVPTQYKTFGGYLLMSSVCGAYSSIHAGGKYPLNLWVLLIGPSAGRKSSAMMPFQHVMQKSEYLRNYTLPDDTTGAALREPLEKTYQNAGPIFGKDNAKVTGTFFIQEFQDFYAKGGDDFSAFLVKLWGDLPYVPISRVGVGDFNLISPTVSFLGSIQTLRVLDVIPMSAWRQGFFPRMLHVYSDQNWPKTDIDPVGWSEGEEIDFNAPSENSYGDKLMSFEGELVDMTTSAFVCGFDRQASEYFNSVTLPKIPLQLSDYNNRRDEHFRKLSALTAISRAWENTFKRKSSLGRTVLVTLEDVTIAHKLLAYNDANLNKFTKDSIRSPHAELYDRLDEYIIEKGGEITNDQIKSFVKNETTIDRTDMMVRVIKNNYLKKNSKTSNYYKIQEEM